MSWRELIRDASLLLPAWWVWNPGQGGGGSGTVHTDGVTIQGDGSVATPIALLDAETDGTSLLGAGISANKLRIQPVGYYTGGAPDVFVGTAAGFIGAYGVVIPSPLTFSHLTVIVGAHDPAETVDMGLYDYAGNLVANIGGRSLSANGLTTFATLQGVQTIPQGLYLFAESGTGNTFGLYGNQFGGNMFWYFAIGFESALVPGTLPATVTTPAIAPAQGNFNFALW